ncbi:FtsK/SpoIIIE domain-containing protein [Enterococcus faecium]|uniref:FtsK/SpoIIIE domain-containing protein n=1 Tax=Enterococcus faecium TaxID=1352 RepID=UPI003513DDAB
MNQLNNQIVLDIIFYWTLPIAVMIGLFLLMTRYTRVLYERLDIDRIWRLFVRVAIWIGVLSILVVWIGNSVWFRELTGLGQQGFNWLSGTDVAKKATEQGLEWWQSILQFLFKWIPPYFRAFVIVWFLGMLIYIQSLIWRVSFTRGANIIISTVLVFPYLAVKYFFGYQTPIFDFVQSRLYVAKLKENLNDSYFNALQGVDERGQKFESGAGGTAQTQRIKSATIAIRRTRAIIKTAGGNRHAELKTRPSRETDTDRLIEQSLKGLGQRLSAPSIRFQDDPILNPSRGGYIFDSDVYYNAGDALGTFRSIFTNPFSIENRISNGGEGFIKVLGNVFISFFNYLKHLTPPAMYERANARMDKLYTPDTSAETAKFPTQHNLDLTVVPTPIDPDTGNDVSTQTAIAQKVATERIDDVTNALNAYKLGGTFDKVLVGGNTAIYQYTLPRSANLPTDFAKVQEGISNMLKTPNVPIIKVVAGILTLTMVNGVNIPTDFSKMIMNRPKGMKSLITGIAGVDALGNNIYVELGDKIPHAMLFGKTGTGKTVTIMDIVFSIMDAVDPSMLRIAYIDGKGNSFEFMRTDNPDSPSYHPNPFTYAQPADGSGDIDYARALLKHLERETRRRIELFKQRGVSKLAEFNKRYPDEALFEILLVADEFSALTDLDKQLKASEMAEKSITDTFEYLAKMARSVGIRMLLANQTARKEKVPGKISANIAGRISLGVTEPIESDIALPDSKIAVHLIDQAGEFYSTMNGIRNAEHGNSPFLPDEVMFALNDGLERKFGHNDYVVTREEILAEMEEGSELGGGIDVTYPIPEPMPTVHTSIDELVKIITMYPEWANANKDSIIFEKNENLIDGTPKERREKKSKLSMALIEAIDQAESLKPNTRRNSGNLVADINKGNDKNML